MLWLTGGSLVVALMMIVGLLLLVLANGLATFWPAQVPELRLRDGRVLAGEVTRSELYAPAGVRADADVAPSRRRLLRTGNFELGGEHFVWVADADVLEETLPTWPLVVERLTWGRFYGVPVAFRLGDARIAEGPQAAWAAVEAPHGPVRERW
jgi:phosphate transport system permease protein